MLVWRIAKKQHALDRSGQGARLNGGRWNSPGVAVIYAGLTPEISAMEKLVHVGSLIPKDLVLVSIEIPDNQDIYQHYKASTLPEGWNALPSSSIAVELGDRFLSANSHLGLIVPSAVMPEAKNILLNPNHPSYSYVIFTIIRPFEFDGRLLKLQQL